MMRKLRTGLIGCGKAGEIHAKALAQLHESEFCAVCDLDISRAQNLAEEFGVRPYDDIGAMIKESKLHAVTVATPHPNHASSVTQALKRGAHVLVEKPMATRLDDCDLMLSVADRTRLKLGVISQRRFYEPVKRMKDALDKGKIGRPLLGTVTMLGWRDETYYRLDPWRGKWKSEGGGVLVNQSVHQLDLLLWFMGPVQEVCGYWGNLNHPYIEVEDTAVAVLRFKSGGLGSIVVSNSQKPGLYGRVHIHGETGASIGVQTDSGEMFIAGVSRILEPPFNDLWSVPNEKHLLESWQIQDKALFEELEMTNHYHLLQIQDFLESILEEREPLIPGREGRKPVELLNAIYRSGIEHQPIRFPVEYGFMP